MLKRTSMLIISCLIAVTTYSMEYDELDTQIQNIFKQEEKFLSSGQLVLNSCISLALRQKYKKLRITVQNTYANKIIFEDFFKQLFSCEQTSIDPVLIYKLRQATCLIIGQKNKINEIEELHNRSSNFSYLTHTFDSGRDESLFNQNQQSLEYDFIVENSSFPFTPNQPQQSDYHTNQPLETATNHYQLDQLPPIQPITKNDSERSMIVPSVLKFNAIPLLLIPTYVSALPSNSSTNQTSICIQPVDQFLYQTEEEIENGIVSPPSQQNNPANTTDPRNVAHNYDTKYQPFKKFRYK